MNDRAKYERHILQNVDEFNTFRALLKSENVKSYLEVGSKNGGSLYRMATKFDRGARVVSVDLPHGDLSFKQTLPNLEACVAHLKSMGYDAHLIVGDSTAPEVVEKVRALGPFDACFIDANHTRPFVEKDWTNYGPMCRIVAFHDIGYLREGGTDSKKLPIEVPEFWNEVKNGYRHVEIKREATRTDPATGKKACDNGIGVLWR